MKKVLIILSLLLSGCALTGDQTKPELKMTLIQLSNNYLNGLNKGDFKMVQNVIDWEGYQESCKCSIPQVKSQMVGISKDSPLKNLAVTKVTSNKDEAQVTLRGLSGKLLDKEIEIYFHWNGSGWLVKGDNVFSGNGLLSSIENNK